MKTDRVVWWIVWTLVGVAVAGLLLQLIAGLAGGVW